MAQSNITIDEYIARSASFALPVLEHLRRLVHEACPDIEETIKWSFPCFVYEGEILCYMSAFKQHCSFGFWKAALLKDKHKLFKSVTETGMGDLGKIKSLDDLPADAIIIEYIREGMILNKEKIKIPRKNKSEKTDLEVPGKFIEALSKNKKAKVTFDAFSYSNKKEYLDWVNEAKTESTAQKRIDQAMEWMAEGKIRNWKYVK